MRYPVIFGLTGFTGSGVNYLNRRFLFQALDEMLDDLILNQGMPGVITCCRMPDVARRQPVRELQRDGPLRGLHRGGAGAVHRRDFRTNGMRGCIGGSSGALARSGWRRGTRTCSRRSRIIPGTAPSSTATVGDVPAFVQAMEKYNYDVGEFIRRIPEIQPKDDAFNEVLNLVAMSACYSPNPAAPLGFELAVRRLHRRTGSRRCGRSGRLRPGEPGRAAARQPAPAALIFIDCGKKDQFGCISGRQVHRNLEKAGIEHVYEEYDSDHFCCAASRSGRASRWSCGRLWVSWERGACLNGSSGRFVALLQ
jgi:enterochelin esterase family protein